MTSVMDILGKAQTALNEGKWEEASKLAQAAGSLEPGNPNAWAVEGIASSQMGNTAKAARLLEKALNAVPNMPRWKAFLSAIYRQDCRMDEALVLAQEALQAAPMDADLNLTLGLVLNDSGRYDEALCYAMRAVGLSKDMVFAHLFLGELLSAREDWRAGWMEMEWRNKTPEAIRTTPNITSPYWNGMELPGKLLAIGDQGYGDTIQFARYLPAMAERCKGLIVGCSPEMLPLIKQVPGPDVVVTGWQECPAHAAHVKISSAPFVLGIDRPEPQAPYLQAESPVYSRTDDKLRVGLAWSGRPTHANDKKRSMSLETLLPLTEVLNPEFIEFVAIQKKIPDRDQEWVPHFPGMRENWIEPDTFADTANMVAGLDLLITVDSAPAHLAGALGVEAHVMLAMAADWRWGLNRKHSLWYDGLTLYRQEKAGDWSPVITQITEMLNAR